MTATVSHAEFAPSIKMHHATRAKAAKLAATLLAEYPAILLVAQEGDEIDHDTYTHGLAGFAIVQGEEDGEQIGESFDKVPGLADVLDACAEAEIDPTKTGDDEEEEVQPSGSVVPEVYRAQYRLVSTTGTTCGDWLAEWLVAETTDAKGKLSIDDLTAIFDVNGLNLSAKWATSRGSRGWQGRYRMSGRQVLERIVALQGWALDAQGSRVDAPEDWLVDMRSKHGAHIAKATKAAKAAVGA